MMEGDSKEKGHSTYEDHIENIGEKATVYKKTTFVHNLS